MLQYLKIQNYALINEVEINFHKGLNIITGETGAGKSILLGALGLILANRADNSVLNNNEKKCIVEGVFDIRNYPKLKELFVKYDLDIEDYTIIRREIAPNGKSRAFINDTPVNLNILREVSEELIDIHSQHQTLKLNDPTFQLALLDAFSDNRANINQYKKLFLRYKGLNSKLEELQSKDNQLKKDLDYLQFQYNEIEKANLQPQENIVLEEELLTLSNSEKISSNLKFVLSQIDENDNSISNQLAEIKRALVEIAPYNPVIEKFNHRIENLSVETKDLLLDIQDFESRMDVDDQRLAEVTERLNLINHLLSKHQLKDTSELIEFSKELKQRLNDIDFLEEDIENTKSEIESISKDLFEQAEKISALRQENIPIVEKELVKLLSTIGINNATIQFDHLKLGDSELNESGKDKINILFSSNKGIQAKSINKVASGGELSRLMLSIKYLQAGIVLMPSIVFDEIDIGTSGEIAIKVGQIIKELSNKHQIISITHLPQVAAMGNKHLLVYKEFEDNITRTKIKSLSQDERINEIAKMMGGEKPSEHNIQSSKELLQRFS